MIRSPKNPISETHRWIDYTVGYVGIFFFHGGEKLAKVDMVDTIMDKFESMNSAPHFLPIQFSNNDFLKCKSGNGALIVLAF